MSQTYFNSEHVSNSLLKDLHSRLFPKPKPANINAIFDFGNEFENVILEPHKVNHDFGGIDKAIAMGKTFNKDHMLRQMLLTHDFRRQHEFYRNDRYGLKARCKTDGDSASLRLVFELKGLAVDNEKMFEEAIDYLDYDQGIAWYLDVCTTAWRPYDTCLFAAVSKTNTDRLFKRIVDRSHKYYKRGKEKVINVTNLWKMTVPKPSANGASSIYSDTNESLGW